MRRKRPVFLLEILIALSLVSLCIVPLLKGPLELHQKEVERLRKIELGRIAAWTFTEVVEKFLKNEIKWEQIPLLGTESEKRELSSVELKLPPLPKKTDVSRKFCLKTIEEKREGEEKIHRLVAVRLMIGERQFTYRLTVTKDVKPLYM